MVPTVGYLRVSTPGQAEDGKYGIEAQRESVKRWADRTGHEIVAWVEEVGSGASDEEREKWQEILHGEYETVPAYQAVAVAKNDRASRDTKMYFYYLYTLEKRGVELCSAEEEFPDNGLANIYRALMMFVAEQERKNIKMRMNNGKRVKAAAGGYVGGQVALGFKVSNKKKVIDEEGAETVRRIFTLVKKKGKTMREAMEIVNAEGRRTKTGREFDIQAISKILGNAMDYRGYNQFGKAKDKKNAVWVAGEHPAILAGASWAFLDEGYNIKT